MAAVARYSRRIKRRLWLRGRRQHTCHAQACQLLAGVRRAVGADEHAYQFELSVSSLRASNMRIPVALFSHGPLAPEIAALCSRFGVMVPTRPLQRPAGRAVAAQAAMPWRGTPCFTRTSTSPSWPPPAPEQVLCCDLDTIFFTDVEVVFDRYAGPDVVAREEVYSGRSIHGADRAFIDEPLLEHLARPPGPGRRAADQPRRRALQPWRRRAAGRRSCRPSSTTRGA